MPSRTVRIVAASLLFSASVLAQGTDNEVRCDYQRREFCSKDGCKPFKGAKSYLVIPSLSKLKAAAHGGEVELRLCDPKSCEVDTMRVASSGAFLNLTQANGGTDYMSLWAMSEPNLLSGEVLGDFMDEVRLFLQTTVGFGHCPFPKQ